MKDPARQVRKARKVEPVVDGRSGTMEFSSQAGKLALDVEQILISTARKDLHHLILRSAMSRKAYLVSYANDRTGATALLIDPSVLQLKLMEIPSARLLSEIVETLPHRRLGSSPVLDVVQTADNELPPLDIP